MTRVELAGCRRGMLSRSLGDRYDELTWLEHLNSLEPRNHYRILRNRPDTRTVGADWITSQQEVCEWSYGQCRLMRPWRHRRLSLVSVPRQ